MDEAWGFIWIMLILKIPVALLLWLVWWAIRATPEPEPATDGSDGGLGDRRPHGPRPLPSAPRRRGPHGEPAPPAPPRTRVPAKAMPSPDRAQR